LVYDLPSGRVTTFVPPISMSDDGKIAYLADIPSLAPFSFARLLVANSDGAGARFVGFVPGGAHEILLSGDGQVLFVVAGDPQFPGPYPIFRFNVASGAVDAILFGSP
jgi:hypothetical protein